jgi:uncharacterized SAM-binding protein YcdF (DUF218 family)
MCPVGANALVWQLESRVPEPAACAGAVPSTIVVLAAGFEREPADAGDFTALESDSIRRALAGIELWRRTPGATLVFAGGGPFAISESAALQHLAELLGVSSGSIRREERSQTTWENAQQLRLQNPALPSRIWLVSSALHLPRALIAFRAAGFDPCMYASDRRYLPPGGVGYYLPQSSALIKTEEALHEIVGQALYRWRAAEVAR